MRNDLLSLFLTLPLSLYHCDIQSSLQLRRDRPEVRPKKSNDAQPCGEEGVEPRTATGPLAGHEDVVVTHPDRYTACISINHPCGRGRVVILVEQKSCVLAKLDRGICQRTKGAGGSFGDADHMRFMGRQLQEQEMVPPRPSRPKHHFLLRFRMQPCIAAAPLRTVRRSAAFPRCYGPERRHLEFRNEDNGRSLLTAQKLRVTRLNEATTHV